MKNIDIDKSTWQKQDRSRGGWRSLIRPKLKQSLLHRQTADDNDYDYLL